MLARMNAIASVRYEDHRRATIKGVARLNPANGKLQTFINLQVRIECRSRVYATLRINGRSGEESAAETSFKLADTNEPLKRALYLYGTVEHDWRGLFMVYEAIRDDHRGTAALEATTLIPASKLDAFTGTANSYKALGKDARHGSVKSGYSTTKMTLSEARALIRKLFESWIANLFGCCRSVRLDFFTWPIWRWLNCSITFYLSKIYCNSGPDSVGLFTFLTLSDFRVSFGICKEYADASLLGHQIDRINC